ncbi:hypothetical protein BC332_17084 [Capsicum chinense]|nr:hypothetical protein BC332_34461 [Capsicum chinense]PHU15879.1 hypothetical protein BC332_17084 [Capsicum chinense]
MEPNSLFIPQYLDSDLVLFVHHGEARVGHIYRDELAERHLKHGDVYTIPAGSAFYLENRAENERLCIICSIDITSESMGWHAFQSFFIVTYLMKHVEVNFLCASTSNRTMFALFMSMLLIS